MFLHHYDYYYYVWFYKRRLKFCVGSWIQQETPEEGYRTYKPKHYEYNNKDKDPEW